QIGNPQAAFNPLKSYDLKSFDDASGNRKKNRIKQSRLTMRYLQITTMLLLFPNATFATSGHTFSGRMFFYAGIHFSHERIATSLFDGRSCSWNPYGYNKMLRYTTSDLKFMAVYVCASERMSGHFTINRLKRIYALLNGESPSLALTTGNLRLDRMPADYRTCFNSIWLDFSHAFHFFKTQRFCYGPGINTALGQISADLGENIGSTGNFKYLTFGPAFHICLNDTRRRILIIESVRLSWGLVRSSEFVYPPRLLQAGISLFWRPDKSPLTMSLSIMYGTLNYRLTAEDVLGQEQALRPSEERQDRQIEISFGAGI
ncbi:hypothetical protein JXJ21_16630, partial [candidate division KSB1 bacterium]|nr:hypothetical protein [candidate division KSB1 bacterium]